MQNNFVAKHCRTWNKATVQRDRTKFHRPSARSFMDEWYEENEGWDEHPGVVKPKEFETPSISANVNKRSLTNKGDNMELTAMAEPRKLTAQELHDQLYGNVDQSLIKLEPKMHNHLNWVFDLETLATCRNAIVTEVSAIGFNILSGEIVCQFTKHLDIDEQVRLGREISASTLGFWLDQPRESRMKLRLSDKEYCDREGERRPHCLMEALLDLTHLIKEASAKWAIADEQKELDYASAEPLVWGNGINFDLGKVESLYEAVPHVQVPWSFWAERDARTLMDLLPGCKRAFGADFQGIPHYGLDDCKHELRYLSAAYIHLWELSKQK